VEAALAGRLLIVSESSGLIEATRGLPGVRRVRPGDASAIAEAVRDVIAGWPTQREEGEEAARHASRRFGPERYRASIVDLVGELVDRHG
jgi:glycosyltransferase involved in cell wall biosynthesis